MPEVYLTKMQARSARVKKALKVRILDQNTDQKCLAKKAGMKYGTLNKRVNEPETCSLDELWRIEKSQLPLFQHEPSRICNKNTWWLRDVISNTSFILVSNRGYARYATATNSVGVRPVFCIY